VTIGLILAVLVAHWGSVLCALCALLWLLTFL
jgi:hypothetical protein